MKVMTPLRWGDGKFLDAERKPLAPRNPAAGVRALPWGGRAQVVTFRGTSQPTGFSRTATTPPGAVTVQLAATQCSSLTSKVASVQRDQRRARVAARATRSLRWVPAGKVPVSHSLRERPRTFSATSLNVSQTLSRTATSHRPGSSSTGRPRRGESTGWLGCVRRPGRLAFFMSDEVVVLVQALD
jgi:hypothetical protein